MDSTFTSISNAINTPPGPCASTARGLTHQNKWKHTCKYSNNTIKDTPRAPRRECTHTPYACALTRAPNATVALVQGERRRHGHRGMQRRQGRLEGRQGAATVAVAAAVAVVAGMPRAPGRPKQALQFVRGTVQVSHVQVVRHTKAARPSPYIHGSVQHGSVQHVRRS